jgi:ACS family hexuronate transporter-like MFS transporter
VAEFFPMQQRATAMGIINAGTAVGAMVAPPLIAVILSYTTWRWIFVVTGGLGIVWTLAWTFSRLHPAATQDRSSADLKAAHDAPSLPWTRLFSVREIWGLVTAKFLSDAAWFFYLFWLPKYLYEARGFDVKAVGTFAWMPSAAAGVGCLLGGGFSSYLVQRDFSLGVARKTALGLSAALMPFVILIPHVPISFAIALFCVAYFGQQSWSTLVMVLPADLFPQSIVGSVAGLVGFGGALGGIVFGELVGYLLDHGLGYGTVFAFAGTLHIAAFGIILASIPVVHPLSLNQRLGCEVAR